MLGTLTGCKGCIVPVLSEPVGGDLYLYPSFGPGGDSIAFVWEPGITYSTPNPLHASGGIWIMDTTGHNRRQIKKGDGFNSPLYSPEGKWLLFSNVSLYKVNLADRSLITLSQEGWIRKASWSADGNSIVYDCDTSKPYFTRGFHLRLMDKDGVNRRPLDWTPAMPPGIDPISYSPAWVSLNRITFMSWWGIAILDIDTLKYKLLQAQGSSQNAARVIAVSPDGHTIIDDMNAQIWRVMTDDPHPALIVSEGKHPAWSPDGKSIIYVAPDPGDHAYTVIWMMDANGSNRRAITRTADDE